ncbi:MAG: protein-(glutamine-N5) methyltransferase, release factor-specific, partial [Actinomycetes bacterium]
MASPDGTVSHRELLAEAVRRFTAAGVASPESDARRVVEEVVGAHGAALTLALSEPVSELRMA